jgi:hypothetical protein
MYQDEEIDRMKRKILGALLGLTFLMNTCSAQEVTVTGSGTDRDSATRDAMRMAVEQVVGTFIDSKTLVEKSAVALDEVYAKSQGYVRNVRILNEGQGSAGYMVTATVDVDTNSDSALMDRMSMIMMLNDPRIAVVILKDDPNTAGEVINDDISETALNDKLLELGFSHVVDANLLSKLQNSALLNSIYNGQRGLVGEVDSYGIDYLVLGKAKTDAQAITVPARGGGYVQTLLNSGRASLNVKIIKFDTGDIVGTFAVNGQGVDNSNERANDKALQDASGKAAEKLQEKFKKLTAAVTQSVQVKVTANDYDKVTQLVEELRHVSGVQNVYIREHNGRNTLLELDTVQKPHFILQSLKQNSKLGIFVEKISNSGMELSLS